MPLPPHPYYHSLFKNTIINYTSPVTTSISFSLSPSLSPLSFQIYILEQKGKHKSKEKSCGEKKKHRPYSENMNIFFRYSSKRINSCTSSIIFLLLLLQLVYAAKATAFKVPTVEFNKGFTQIFGHSNLVSSSDDKSVQLLLNQYTGSGFRSSDLYNHGFFSARIKLPSDYTAGIVVAFYTSNGDVFEKTHDELDFEFLGNIRGKAWRFQTNLYGNGSTSRGREERYTLWFDPSKEFHRYSILWSTNKIIFFIDEIPIREILKSDKMAGDFPSKPMALYATIWDASNWATSGGKYKVNYKYAPFITEFTDLVLHGCAADPIQEMLPTSCAQKDDELEKIDYANVTPKQRTAMKKFREKYMYYSYCYDTWRYPIPPPECVIDPALRKRFKDSGRPKFERRHRGHSKRMRDVSSSRSYGDHEED